MAFDETLAARVRDVIGEHPGLREQKMFGGLAFLIDGNMSVGVVGDELMVRVGADAYEDALELAHARPMDFTGRPMRGFVHVAQPGFRTAAALEKWVDRGVEYASSLPKKG